MASDRVCRAGLGDADPGAGAGAGDPHDVRGAAYAVGEAVCGGNDAGAVLQRLPQHSGAGDRGIDAALRGPGRCGVLDARIRETPTLSMAWRRGGRCADSPVAGQRRS